MQQRSERTVRRLILSAAAEFDRGGYARTTMDDITRAAGVTKGALYFHFSSKDELADAVQIRGRDLVEDFLEDVRTRESSPLQMLVDVTHHLNLLLHEEPAVRASVRIARERALRPAPSFDFYRTWLDQAWQLLQEAQTGDELGMDIADTPARTLITSVTSGVEVLSWTGVPYADASRWLTGLWDLLLPALARDEAVRRVRTMAPEVTWRSCPGGADATAV
ncbi:ScbR family autoregulator-binding transcription factor [Streptomyces sp. NPDC059373]